MPETRNRPGDDSGAASQQVGETEASVTDPWADTYRDARRWVAWNARRRWPDFPCNDDIWAASATSWWHGGRSGRAA